MLVPLPLIVVFITIFFSIISLILGWGYAIITQNTKALSDLSLIVARLEERYNSDDKLCNEKHNVLNRRIDELNLNKSSK